MTSAGRHFTASHWGLYEVENDGGNRPRLKPFGGDPDPSPIGLDQLDDNVTRLTGTPSCSQAVMAGRRSRHRAASART